MNKIRTLSVVAGIAGVFLVITRGPLAFAFTSKAQQVFTASVTVGTGGPSGTVALSLPQPLPLQAFFGKNVVIPVQLQGSAATMAQIQKQPGSVVVVYQLFNSGGSAASKTLSLPISFQFPPGQATILNGTAIIPVQDIQAARQGGSLAYFFTLQNGSPLNSASVVHFIDTLTASVGTDPNSGSIVTVPDTTPATDGKTSLIFAPGALSGPGSVVIHQLDQLSVPSGPGGLSPIVVYDFELQGTSLSREVQIGLTYPWNPDGSIIGTNGNPGNLAPYWLQGPGNWSVMGPRQLDSTKHLVSITSPHFSTFALFLSGATSAADLRPKHRILTPNGDGINDTIDFSGIGPNDGVIIFNVKGRRVKTLSSPNLVWDGTDDSGRIVESGIYVYQYTSQGERISGVILVAK